MMSCECFLAGIFHSNFWNFKRQQEDAFLTQIKDNKNELKSLSFASTAAHLKIMSREGSMHCFVMFGEGSNFTNPLHPMSHRSPTSMKDLCLSRGEGSALLAPPSL